MAKADGLRIGILAPPWLEVPPPAYGGVEWICYWLVEELIARGHDVTLVAAGRPRTRAQFYATYEVPPIERLHQVIPELVHVGKSLRILGSRELDVVHDHSVMGPLSARARHAPSVVTVHGSITSELKEYYRSVDEMVSLVAISQSQSAQAAEVRWKAVVHNGIPVEEYKFQEVKEDFVLFMGRLGPAKGAHFAIDAARAAGMSIVLAAKCREPEELTYLEKEIKPRLGKDAEWIGEADVPTKRDLLARARCLIFPIRWEEPFGIVMVEALASGTPVVALRRGSVPEVVVDGRTGFVCDDPGELASALHRAGDLDPRACREDAQQRFHVKNMVDAYEGLYLQVAGRGQP